MSFYLVYKQYYFYFFLYKLKRGSFSIPIFPEQSDIKLHTKQK